MKLNIIKYSSPITQAQNLAHKVAQQLSEVIAKKDRATLAVPGGTTPGPFLSALSNEDINWSKVIVTLTDERWVDIDSERSNLSLICQKLKQNKAKSVVLLPLYHAVPTPEDALPLLEKTLMPYLPLDVCVVGMGDDMHTASLFPNAHGLKQALSKNTNRILAPIRPIDSDEIRITLTAPVLDAATEHHILIKGESKLTALKKATEITSTHDAPIRIILEHSSALIHYAP